VSLGETHVQLGTLRRLQGEPAAAAESCTVAIRLLEGVLAPDRTLPEGERWMSAAYEGRARAHARSGRLAQALGDCGQALRFVHGAAHRRLVQCLAQEADFAPLQGRKEFDDLLKQAGAPPAAETGR
jgi:hypothetical protein